MTLRLRDIEAGYGQTTVLRGVSLVVPDGAVVALLGANGAGKTTLLRAASGMLPVTRGRVELDGEDLTGARVETIARRGMAHIPEGRSIYPRMTVRENISLFSRRGDEAGAIDRATAAFPRLGERLSQVAGTLSGGEQQMLALARCYVTSPKVILVDEVSVGLAPKVIDEIFAFLETLVAHGTALLLVEQYVTRALAMADYVYILKKGLITFAGEPFELDAQDVFREYVGVAVA
jgi:branched-chain amino acid transport system ATP-binding protein